MKVTLAQRVVWRDKLTARSLRYEVSWPVDLPLPRNGDLVGLVSQNDMASEWNVKRVSFWPQGREPYGLAYIELEDSELWTEDLGGKTFDEYVQVWFLDEGWIAR